MKCAWDSFIRILPLWMRNKVDELGKDDLRELRLRINAPPELVLGRKSVFLARCTTMGDIEFCINMATKYSPWASESIAEGYITIPGGHRLGLCGNVIPGRVQKGFATITSLCIRISRDYTGFAKDAAVEGSVLIIGIPGAGKTTFLRDLVRQLSAKNENRIAVVDERQEIFPYVENSFCFQPGARVDVISGCSKVAGIEMVLRTMTPTIIAVDEITSPVDSEAMLNCVGCGVSLIATAHASSIQELNKRQAYRLLMERSVFETIVILHTDKTWKLEHIEV